jgi:Glycosyl transferase family 2
MAGMDARRRHFGRQHSDGNVEVAPRPSTRERRALRLVEEGTPGPPILAPPPDGAIEPGPVPTFSVILAAYQAADTIGESVASALGQTTPPLEVIVCDDASTDDIEGALEPYLDRIVFIRRKRNGGQSAAFNDALRVASGDFVSLLDADDVYLPDRNENLGKAAAARPDLDILTTNCVMEVGGRIVQRGDQNWQFEVYDQRRALLERNYIFPHAVVRRSRLEEIGGYDEAIRFTNDWDAFLRLVFSGSVVGQVDLALARYRLREESLSANSLMMKRFEVTALEKAGRSLRMSADEHEALKHSLAERRRACRMEEAREALRAGSSDARRLSLSIAVGRGYGLPTRLKSALGAVSPVIARELLLARDRRRWVGAGDIVVSRRDVGA